MCVCARARARACVLEHVCVCVRERERERERERGREGGGERNISQLGHSNLKEFTIGQSDSEPNNERV